MASFFKRAVTAALERREEVQDQNIVLQEKAVEENLDRLKKVEELREKFKIICISLCSKIDSIDERLSNIDIKNES